MKQFRIRKYLHKRLLIPLFGFCALGLLTAGLICYQIGLFDVSFVKRSDEQTAAELLRQSGENPKGLRQWFRSILLWNQRISHGQTESAQPGNQDPGTNPDLPLPPPNADDPTRPSDLTYEDVQKALPTVDALEKNGFHHSSDSYQIDQSRLARLSGIRFPQVYSMRSNGAPGDSGVIPLLRAYMGYLLYDSGEDALALLTRTGGVAAASLGELQPAYFRDAAGHPLFTDGMGKYYYVLDGQNTVAEVAGIEAFTPAICYDSPLSQNKNTSGLYRYYVDVLEARRISATGEDITYSIAENVARSNQAGGSSVSGYQLPYYTIRYIKMRKWGYTNAAGTIVIDAKYDFASDFDENGYAFVTDLTGKLRVIDRTGRTVLNPYGPIFHDPTRGDRAALTAFVQPRETGIDALGYYRFGHGYARVRIQTYDYFFFDTPLTDEEYLVDVQGNRFEIPAGYTLRGYSDGILLLERDGLYGYYSVEERWIVQPVYSHAGPFVDGLAVVAGQNGKYGMIDTAGNVVLPRVYDSLSTLSSGLIVAYQQEYGWSVLHHMTPN